MWNQMLSRFEKCGENRLQSSKYLRLLIEKQRRPNLLIDGGMAAEDHVTARQSIVIDTRL